MIPPNEFMYMPPGKHTFTAQGIFRYGRKKPITIPGGEVWEEDAVRMNNFLQRLRKMSLYRPQMPFPYFDFDHREEDHVFYPHQIWERGCAHYQ